MGKVSRNVRNSVRQAPYYNNVIKPILIYGYKTGALKTRALTKVKQNLIERT